VVVSGSPWFRRFPSPHHPKRPDHLVVVSGSRMRTSPRTSPARNVQTILWSFPAAAFASVTYLTSPKRPDHLVVVSGATRSTGSM